MIALSSRKNLILTLSLSIFILFICSTIRHNLFQSGALDLGYHDQILYLLSQGKPPIISFWGYHFLGGHAEWIYYPLSLLYRIYADVHILLAIQAIVLSIAVLPILKLGQKAGLSEQKAGLIAIAYLLYPLIFNINLFDFHPEVIAVPLIFTSVLWARNRNTIGFILSITLILGCRASLSLLVISMGFWLFIFEKRRWYGLYAASIGAAWFGIFTAILLPIFKPDGHHALGRYGRLGSSIGEMAINIFLKPQAVLEQTLTLPNLEYLLLLFIPLLWGLHWRYLAPLIATTPILFLNLLSNTLAQKDIVHQYSVPILPFLILSVIATVADGKNFLKPKKWILAWCLFCFFALAKYGYFFGLYLSDLDTWSANRQAITMIDTQGDVLTNHNLVPHLTHRAFIQHPQDHNFADDLDRYEFVLLNVRHPNYGFSPEGAQQLLARLKSEQQFAPIFEQDDVYLFRKNEHPFKVEQ
ncbi:DUF2079 domain-containing protein [Spirulina sp. CCNP1310]|uniref:DUF2079 domain-containing protein n=1 Tax=Spirulina sp. CCNP1310 TaxID=3110249 RepID=UPI002B21DFB3|nr:DUF2079 domain-containing protein [Spirulina sp. CCNP1310]MEA5418139.1 DUF2079 domain-containing protein [Spirulina sp. CCNP1310]